MNDFSFDPYQSSRIDSGQAEEQFRELEATELYCPNCGRAVPVTKVLLLVLPEGDKYEYRCRFCGTTVGDKISRTAGRFSRL